MRNFPYFTCSMSLDTSLFSLDPFPGLLDNVVKTVDVLHARDDNSLQQYWLQDASPQEFQHL